MKGMLKFLMGLIPGLLLGWGLGYIRVPLIEYEHAFGVGMATCLGLVLLIVALRLIWKKDSFLDRMGEKKAAGGASSGKRSRLGLSVGLLIVVGSLMLTWKYYHASNTLETKAAAQQEQIEEQSATISNFQKEQQASLIGNVLSKVDADLAADTAGRLEASTIARIAALSHLLRPYMVREGDSLMRKLSPERGQLLLALAAMDLDSVSIARIWADALFAGADLRGAKMAGMNLSGVNLNGADLQDADLRGANLSGANLEKANLWGAILDSANLSEANLWRADVRWAELNGADLQMANLDAVDMRSAKLRGADLRKATMIWADLEGAMLNGANMAELDMLGTRLVKVNMTDANLKEANLMVVNLEDAYLKGANLFHACCSPDFLESLEKWRVDVTDKLQASFKVIEDTTPKYWSTVFRLEEK